MTEKDVTVKDNDSKTSQLKKMLAEGDFVKIPKIGDIVKGKVIDISRSEIRLDIDGLTTGIVRGREFYDESSEYSNLKVDEEVEATVMELENENGEMELSFRFAGHQKAWDNLAKLRDDSEIVKATITDANKGGLMIRVGKIPGFLPVSQLMPEHYPRIPGGDKNKILDRLKSYIGKDFDVKIIDADESDEKLIVSEKAGWEEKQKDVIASYKVGDKVEGKITAVTDFGVFVEFGKDNLEGLVHISELAWQRIDNPSDLVKVGDKIKAEIINVEGSKIFLSMKKLKIDPWQEVAKKYKTGQVVEGTVLKVNPFGLFVELDPDIHGLAHVSELSDRPVSDANEAALRKAGKGSLLHKKTTISKAEALDAIEYLVKEGTIAKNSNKIVRDALVQQKKEQKKLQEKQEEEEEKEKEKKEEEEEAVKKKHIRANIAIDRAQEDYEGDILSDRYTDRKSILGRSIIDEIKKKQTKREDKINEETGKRERQSGDDIKKKKGPDLVETKEPPLIDIGG